ncbi:uncharacterized protein AMSG_10998 [Thecamonas trahens ATCC 50062]|uniref:Uncharacterized protein n=1 Tax=Thecamonas trahens ATCC 50062 TaxID=461836 RepID=A0A0L0DTG8_THETB|nr:hypothetical protein AMSG_10998 [Thecamonas trahens ATCC 50062]KNC55346.1 hypothetical protein AMSG_10998 [Thecamonas trahens ATCC 50062]|eukprot:XP_013753065.1 hypothetical protein AMSG_10998 [Thecamonas trahens ATCC 50062]
MAVPPGLLMSCGGFNEGTGLFERWHTSLAIGADGRAVKKYVFVRGHEDHSNDENETSIRVLTGTWLPHADGFGRFGSDLVAFLAAALGPDPLPSDLADADRQEQKPILVPRPLDAGSQNEDSSGRLANLSYNYGSESGDSSDDDKPNIVNRDAVAKEVRILARVEVDPGRCVNDMNSPGRSGDRRPQEGVEVISMRLVDISIENNLIFAAAADADHMPVPEVIEALYDGEFEYYS